MFISINGSHDHFLKFQKNDHFDHLKWKMVIVETKTVGFGEMADFAFLKSEQNFLSNDI